MQGSLKLLERLMLAIAIGCAGMAIYEVWPESLRFAVIEADRQFDGLAVGQTKKFTYIVKNRTNKPIRVVGAEFT